MKFKGSQNILACKNEFKKLISKVPIIEIVL